MFSETMRERFFSGVTSSSIWTRQRLFAPWGMHTSVPRTRNTAGPTGARPETSIVRGQSMSESTQKMKVKCTVFFSLARAKIPSVRSCRMAHAAEYQESCASVRPTYCVWPMYHMLQSMCQPM